MNTPIAALGRRFLRAVQQPIGEVAALALTRGWPAYSRLILVHDRNDWVIAEEARALEQIARQLGIAGAQRGFNRYIYRQALFFGTQEVLIEYQPQRYRRRQNRLATTWFHGLPGSGIPRFDSYYAWLCANHRILDRIQVSHTEMRDVILSSGIDANNVRLIPIGINPDFFRMQTPDSRQSARMRLGIPQSATVIGSFQKDGDGWGAGLEPKLIKGPDIFLKTIELLRPQLSELFVLLSGPARGYVKAGLERLGVPYRHLFVRSYPDVGELYQALDAYLVTSRQEGGPKAVLESMASGIPLITTRVGQAMDLVEHGVNAWMVPVGDTEGLAHWARYALEHAEQRRRMIVAAAHTAAQHTYAAQLPLWQAFFRGFVDRS